MTLYSAYVHALFIDYQYFMKQIIIMKNKKYIIYNI